MEIIKKLKYVLLFVAGVVLGSIFAWQFPPKRYVSVPLPQSWITQHDEEYFMRYDSLKVRVLHFNDVKAYSELQKMSLDTAFTIRSYDILYYALLMAEKHNNGSACYDVFRILIGPCMKGDSLIDNHNMDIDEFRRIGLHYLKLGEQLGDYNCTKTIYNLLQREQLPPQDWKPIQYYKEKADSLFLLAVNDRK